MNLNGFFEFLHEFFYKTFEIMPVLGNGANYFFLSVMFVLVVYWLRVLAQTPKQD